VFYVCSGTGTVPVAVGPGALVPVGAAPGGAVANGVDITNAVST